MMDGTLLYWHWWVIGIVLAILEVFAPGAVLIWLGVAAISVGVVLLFVPILPWQAQFVLFSVFSVGCLAAWRIWGPKVSGDEVHPTLNRRGEQLKGRVLTLDDPIVNERGKVRVGDTLWKVSGPDMPGGTQVRVVGVDGTILRVVPADS